MSNYNPQPGSTAFRVMEFFTTNPQEELTVQQLESRFDKPAKQWHSILSSAVSSGALKRFENEDDELVYTLGTGVPGIEPQQGRNPTLRPDVLLAGATLGKRVARASAPADLATIELRSGVPLPEIRTGKDKWYELLDRMAVGQSCVLPNDCKGGLGGAVNKSKKNGKAEFALRKVNTTQFGVWRVK